MPDCPYNSYSSSLIQRYGYKVFRVGVDAGFTCPNRCRDPEGRGCIYCDSQGARAAYQRVSEVSFHHDSGFVSQIDSISSNNSICSKNVLRFDYKDIEKQVERGG